MTYLQMPEGKHDVAFLGKSVSDFFEMGVCR